MGIIHVNEGKKGRLIVRFEYSPERVEVIRTIPKRRWFPDEKYLTVPHTDETITKLSEAFSTDRVVVSPLLLGDLLPPLLAFLKTPESE
jgi:hypothetical protein